MKKVVFILCALFISTSAFSQNENLEVFVPVNELKLNLGSAIFMSYPEIAFERIFEESMSFGFSAGVRIGENNLYERFNFHAMSHFRWYFGDFNPFLWWNWMFIGQNQNRTTARKPGTGFFVEANAGVFDRRIRTSGNFWDRDRVYEDKFGAGIGMGFGWKFVMDNNWLFESSFIFGRDFVNNTLYPHFGLSIGRRF